nr:hypothetical protein [Tanacetum cinerariifolium]
MTSENSSQSPPHIDHHCCYGCGDTLDGIFCQRCTCESCRNGAHIGYNCPPKVSIISNPEPCYNQDVDEFPQTLPSFHLTCYSGNENSFTYDSNLNFVADSPNPPPQPSTYSYEFCGKDAYYGHDFPPVVPFIYNPEPLDNFQPSQSVIDHRKIHEDLQQRMNDLMIELCETFQAWLQQQEQVVNLDSYTPEPSQCQKITIYYNDDDEESSTPLRDIIISELPPCVAITPVLSTEELVDSLIMEDEHLETISATKSDEVIKSSIENLVLILSESEGISNDTCDVPFCDNSHPLDVLNDHFEIFYDFNGDCTSSDDDLFEDINYVKASPLDSEPVSLEEVKDEILRVKLLNVNLLIAKIESLNDNPTPDRVLKYPSSFPIPVEEIDSFFEKSDTSLSYSNNSLPEFKTFINHMGELTSIVIKDNMGEPRVHVPNVLPTHLTFHLDLDFTLSSDSLGSDFVVSFPFKTRNKIFDPMIFFEVQSKNFLLWDTFYISFNSDPLCPVIETLLLFFSENEKQVFNPNILSSNLLSHQGKITFDFFENSMMIYGGDILALEVSFLHFYPLDKLKIASDYENPRARSFVLRSLDLYFLSFIKGI